MKSVMNIEDVEVVLKKLEVLKKEEDLIFDDIKKINFKLYYDNQLISDKKNYIDDNLFVMNTTHKNNINFIESKKEEYINTSLNTKNSFRRI